MLELPCPNCGPRPSGEFAYAGEPSSRPGATRVEITDWRRYLYAAANRDDWTTELWLHRAGCGRYVRLQRQRTTNEVRA